MTSRLALRRSSLDSSKPPKPTLVPRPPPANIARGAPVRFGNKRNLAPLKAPKHTVDLPPRCATPARGHNLDDVMANMDETFISEWLVRANKQVKMMQEWWAEDDNGVRFMHFWLSEFDDAKRKQLLEMEFDLLVEEVKLAFQPLECDTPQKSRLTVTDAHIEKVMRSILREYPSQFGSGDDGTAFLDLAWVLSTKGKPGQYSTLLSDVKCSSRNEVYGQWLLAMRSFALITMVTAVTTFFSRFGEFDSRPGTASTTGRPSTSAGRPRTSTGRRPSTSSGSTAKPPTSEAAFAAVKLGFEDVIFFFLSRGMITPNIVDGQARTLLFVAVTYRKISVVNFILENASLFDINRPAQSGNTPLHAAVNNGDAELVDVLIKAGVDHTVTNPVSGATPQMIAEMLENEEILTILPSNPSN